MEIVNQESVTSGWDIIYASQKSVINQKLKTLCVDSTLPENFEDVTVGCPQIVGGSVEKQDELKISIPLEGKINLVKVSGECQFTLNLNNITGTINSSGITSYILTVDLSNGDMVNDVDLSNLNVTLLGQEIPTETIESIILNFMNMYVNSMEPLEFPFDFLVPISLENTIIKFAFVENSLDESKSFFAVLVGLRGNQGVYDLSTDIIYNSVNSNTALVLSNILFMTLCREMLNNYFGEGFGFEISDDDPLKIINTNTTTLLDGGFFWGLSAKVGKNDFVFLLGSDGSLKIEVKLKYRTSKLLLWSSVRLAVLAKLSADNGQLTLNISTSGSPPLWLWFIFPPLAILFKIIADKDGVMTFSIPGFYLDQISTPSYIQISGKWI